MSQQRVANAVGISRSRYARIERNELTDVGDVLLARIAGVLGLDLGLRTYPAGPPLRDAGHLKLLARLRDELGSSWAWSYDVPFPILGDPRAWDAVARCGDLTVACEGEVRLHDVQALIRRQQIKKRDGGLERLILVASDTRTNRAVSREAEFALGSVFPVPARPALDALRNGRDPGGDSLIMV